MSVLSLDINEIKYIKLIDFDHYNNEEKSRFLLEKSRFEVLLFNYLIQEEKISKKVFEIGMPINDELRLLLLNYYINNHIQFTPKKNIIDFHYRVMMYIINVYFDSYNTLCDIILLKIKENQEKIELEDLRELFYEILDNLDIYSSIERDPLEEYDVLTKNKDLKEKYFALRFDVDNSFNNTIKEKAEKILYEDIELDDDELFSHAVCFIENEKDFELDEKLIKRIDDFNNGKFSFQTETYLLRIETYFQFISIIQLEIRQWINYIKSKCYLDDEYIKYDYINFGKRKYSPSLTYKEIQEVDYREFFSAIIYNNFNVKHLYIYLENQLMFNDDLINFFIEIYNSYIGDHKIILMQTFPDNYIEIFNKLLAKENKTDKKKKIKLDNEEEIDIYEKICNDLKEYISHGSAEKYKAIIESNNFGDNRKRYIKLQVGYDTEINLKRFAYVFQLKLSDMKNIFRGKDVKTLNSVYLKENEKKTPFYDTLISIRNAYLYEINQEKYPIIK